MKPALRYHDLMIQSRAHIAAHAQQELVPLQPRNFGDGARWMAAQLGILRGREIPFPGDVPFALYGIGKYGLCLTAALAAAILLGRLHPAFMLIAIPVFYLAEVHLLFLFPLLIDAAPKPVLRSIRASYRMGLLSSMILTMRIAAFMMIGLLQIRNPLKNWYAGCMAVLIWYEHEIGNRA